MSKTDNYESSLSGASSEVASFDEHEKGLFGRLHHLLHTTPALVPLIVLLAAIVVFGLLLAYPLSSHEYENWYSYQY